MISESGINKTESIEIDIENQTFIQKKRKQEFKINLSDFEYFRIKDTQFSPVLIFVRNSDSVKLFSLSFENTVSFSIRYYNKKAITDTLNQFFQKPPTPQGD